MTNQPYTPRNPDWTNAPFRNARHLAVLLEATAGFVEKFGDLHSADQELPGVLSTRVPAMVRGLHPTRAELPDLIEVAAPALRACGFDVAVIRDSVGLRISVRLPREADPEPWYSAPHEIPLDLIPVLRDRR